PAHAGYDLASGRGSPLADRVIADLVSYGATSGTTGTGTGTTSLSPPVLSASAASSTSANLTWNTVTGASGYRLYKISGTTKTLLSTLASTSTTTTVAGLTAGSTNSFMVEAYNSTGVADSNV